MCKPVLIEARQISKHFPGVRALHEVNFTLHSGEIHALVGENGAGKSTLIKVLTGVHAPTMGEIFLQGEKISPQNPKHAMDLKISTVYQEVNLCPNLSVAENIFIGREPRKRGMIDWKTMNKKAQKVLESLHMEINVTKSLDHFSVAVQQMVAIARAIDTEAKVLILDEPTSSLDDQETQRLFAVVRQLREKGLGIVFVSHFLDQIYDLCDHVTILRNGELEGEYSLDQLPKVQLISKMIGTELGDMQTIQNRETTSSQELFLKAENLGLSGKIQPLDLSVHKGEVVGFAGLLGSGRTETASLLFGVDRPSSGNLEIQGQQVSFHSPLDAMKKRMAFCPEDRKLYGIIGDLSVKENIILAIQAKKGMWSHLPPREIEKIAEEYITALKIKVSDQNQLIKNLSGGNQQKVIIGRWLATHPELFILDEPTRGIDIGTKTEIQKMVVSLAAETGMSIIFISSELEEMLRTCTRMAIFRDRKKTAELSGDEMNTHRIMTAIAGGE